MSEDEKPSRNNLKKLTDPFNLLFAFITLILGLFAAHYLTRSDTIYLIDQRINSEEYIKKINEKYRPYMIFELSGEPIINKGAMDEYIEKITTHKEKWPNLETELVHWITIYPKKHLNIIPVLEAMDEGYIITSYRKNSAIVYHLQGSYISTGSLSSRFRLGIIP